MTFTLNGLTHDTSEMAEYLTDNPLVPLLYLAKDKTCVYVVTRDDWKGVGVHQADDVEIKSAAARYNLPDLLLAVRHH